SHESQELSDHALIKRQRRGQLDEDGASFLCEALCLSQKCDKRFSRAPKREFMRNRSWHLDGEQEIARRAVTPLCIGGRGVRPIERRVDLGTSEETRVALEVAPWR